MKILVLTFLIFLTNCKTEHENLVSEIEDLISREKYEKALILISERLSATRSTAEILSKSKPNQPRLLQLSEDRRRVVWTENKTIYFRDLITDKAENIELKIRPENFQISNNAEYAILQYPLKQKGGCAIYAYSLLNITVEYESGVHIPCKTGMGITQKGDKILYFFENNLYEERTSHPKIPKKAVSFDLFPPPFPKLKTNLQLASLGEDWLIWSGAGGAYNLYFLQSKTMKITFLSKDIVLPRITYNNGSSAYVVGGKVGDLYLREIEYSQNRIPSLHRGIPVSTREATSWKLTGKDEFLTGNQNEPLQPMKWKVLGKKEHLPFFLERFWVITGDRIIYENKAGELVLDNLIFGPEDFVMLDYYKKVKKSSDG
ncbi:MAG: hypothetical protein SH817_02460 [Leptospira sp.]|nr:hypothetical protein [Leptospira sp.]